MKKPKYSYFYVLQGKYGFGWEDLVAEKKRRDVVRGLGEYIENEGGQYRVIYRRELN